jgi:hypothetical protein
LRILKLRQGASMGGFCWMVGWLVCWSVVGKKVWKNVETDCCNVQNEDN